jgi:hypothetical protein
MNCDNYRAVILQCTPYEILKNSYVKLVSYADEITGEYHGGFLKGRSTFDQIFTVRQSLEKCKCTSAFSSII